MSLVCISTWDPWVVFEGSWRCNHNRHGTKKTQQHNWFCIPSFCCCHWFPKNSYSPGFFPIPPKNLQTIITVLQFDYVNLPGDFRWCGVYQWQSGFFRSSFGSWRCGVWFLLWSWWTHHGWSVKVQSGWSRWSGFWRVYQKFLEFLVVKNPPNKCLENVFLVVQC